MNPLNKTLPADLRMAICLTRLHTGADQYELDREHPDHNKAISECYSCIHRREVPGHCHIKCVEPDAMMTGDPHGIRNGWFMYPLLFDPTWKSKLCDNYVARQESTVSPAISPAVSHAK